MRHIWSLIIGLVITPLAWFTVAVGQTIISDYLQLLRHPESRLLVAGLLLAGAGLFLGLIGSLRTSPLGALFAAAVYLGDTLYLALAPQSALDVFHTTFKLGDYVVDMGTPLYNGTLAVVGGMLLMAAFSVGRWRGSAPADAGGWTPPPAAPAWEPTTTPTPTSSSDPAQPDPEQPDPEWPASDDEAVTTDKPDEKSSGGS